MEILLLLLPISFVLVGAAVSLFIWAINHDQFEDLDRSAIEALEDSDNSRTLGDSPHE
ncbi:MAG: cbb3-type cytochrome oxidase maturation protein [Candidatus Azotimanducaceae bacterium]|jgi:cbb3-type cytochrome oxidase maturation protein